MRVLPGLSSLLVVTACASSSPGPAPAPTAPAPAATTTNVKAAPPDEPAQKPETSIDSQREPFSQMCMQQVPNAEYCDCAWSEYKQIFSGEDLEKDLPRKDPRFAALQERTANNCATKLPEATVKQVFIEGCAKKEKRRMPYCECTWSVLRKRLALADFVRLEADSAAPRMVEARNAIPKECKGTIPKDLEQADFMSACAQGDAGRTKACACVWKKVSAKYSPEAIRAGVADLEKVPGLADCKNATN